MCRVNMVDGHVYFFYWELSATIASKRDVTLDGHMSAPDLLHTRGKKLCILIPDNKVDIHKSLRKQVYFSSLTT